MASNYTVADVYELEKALATGANRVTHGGTTVEFKSRDEMLAQLDLMRRELGISADGEVSTTPRIRRIRYVFGKGL